MEMMLLFFIGLGLCTANSIDIGRSSCDQKDCIRCDLETGQCMKCQNVMFESTRECQTRCPSGYEATWSLIPSIHGKVCSGLSVLSLVSQKEVTIIAAASVGGAICIGILLGILLLRKREKKSPPPSPILRVPKLPHDRRPKTEEIFIRGKEKEEFVSQLRPLRSEAPYILRMIVESRAKFRSTSGPDATSDTKTKACRAVVRDLSRVLALVSQKEETIKSAPKDWRRLLSWTERLLSRYKRQHKLKNIDGTKNRTTLFVSRKQAMQDKKKICQNYYFGQTLFSEKESKEESKEDLQDFQDLQDFMSIMYMSDTCSLAEDGQSLVESVPQVEQKKKKDFLNIDLFGKLRGFDQPTFNPDPIIQSYSPDEDEETRSDFIASEAFFDHIESFAFEDDFSIENELERNDSNNNKRTDSAKVRERNLKNLNNAPKRNRRTKIKRISSSLLLKGRWENGKKDTVRRVKRKRPLKRQRQVEKDKKEKLMEKYSRKSIESMDSNDSQNVTINKQIEGDDIYLGVVKNHINVKPMQQDVISVI